MLTRTLNLSIQGRIQQGLSSNDIPIITLPTSANITDVSAILGATLDCNNKSTEWSIEYGTTILYDNVQTGDTTTINGIKTVEISGLSPETLIHWRVKAVNSDGIAYSDDQQFSTLIGTANLVQRFVKANQPISQDSGTKAIDYSTNQLNADIWQSCLSGVGNVHTFYNAITSTTISIDWQTDGQKIEFIASIRTGQTESVVGLHSLLSNFGVLVRTASLRCRGYKSDGTTSWFIDFATLATPANDTQYRFKIERSGNNLIGYKTSPSDTTYANATTQTVNVSTTGMYIDAYSGTKAQGKVSYLDISGYKFAFGEGNLSNFCYSFNSNYRISVQGNLSEWSLQNVYSHNSIYGYSRVYCKYALNNRDDIVNLAYNIDGTSMYEVHKTAMGYGTYNVHNEEFPPATSWGSGYGIKLDASIEAYDQENTFFDTNHVAKLVYKGNVPSKLNNRIYYNPINNNEILIYDADKTLIRPINTASKKILIVGDSVVVDNLSWWANIFLSKTGLISTSKGYSGKKMATEIQELLTADVAITPTLISDKDFILLEGGFNDFGQNTSEVDFASGIASLYAYVRAQNPTAYIIVIAPYYWYTTTSTPDTENTAGMTRREMCQLLSNLVTANPYRSMFVDWRLSGYDVTIDSSNDLLHPNSIASVSKLVIYTCNQLMNYYD